MFVVGLITALTTAAPLQEPNLRLMPALPLATFGVKAPTTYAWWEQNDPVMGGKSSGNFSVVEDHGHFTGVVRNISAKLNAPGFCRVTTGSLLIKDASKYLDGGLELTLRSSTPAFGGYRMAFSAVGVPVHNGGHELVGSYKAGFAVKAGEADAWQTVYIPFNMFSWDWSDFSGSCSTKDPNGYQHKCCGTHAEVCPSAKTLSVVDGFAIWAEGAEGDFTIDVKSIAAVSGPSAAADVQV